MYIYLIQKCSHLIFCLLLYAGHKLNVLDCVRHKVSLSSFSFTLFKKRELALLYFVKLSEECRI